MSVTKIIQAPLHLTVYISPEFELLMPSHPSRLMQSSGLCLRFAGMDFHEDLPRLGEKEGLKGRKLSKAVESFTWNITVLKVLKAKHNYIRSLRFYRIGGR